MREPSEKFARAARVAITLIASSVLAPACVYDFDGLREPTGSVDGGGGDAGADGGRDTEVAEVGPGEDAGDGGVIVDEYVFGAACADDAGCGDGVCAEGFCTRSCAEDACESGATCADLGAGPVCVPRCDLDYTCDLPGGAALACTQSRFGASPYLVERAATFVCRPDGDGDGVADAEDNCVEVLNASQRDRDGDGEGDACDAAPLCHPAAVDGVVSFPSVAWENTSSTLPQIIDNGWAPLLGGLGPEGEPTTAMLALARDEVAWSTPGELLYPGVDFASTPLKDGAYLVSPGRAPGDPRQTGRMLRLERDGTLTQLGTVSRREIYDPVMATTSTGSVLMLAYTTSSAEGGLTFRIMRVLPETDGFNGITTAQLSSRGEWRASPSGRGGVIFYTEPLEDLEGGAPFTRVFEIDAGGGTVIGPQSYGLPLNEAGQPIDPLFVETPSGLSVVFDRGTGQAFTLSEVGVLERAASLDQELTVNEPSFMVRPSGLGVVVVGRSPDDAGTIEAIEWDIGCELGDEARDMDMDSVPDIVDTCHLLANAAQVDSDEDGLGDECDADRDGDGIDNDVDGPIDENTGERTSLLASDHDNDGIPDDADDDDDQDGLPDLGDRSPRDTDQDGQDNAEDGDDDGDGYPDRLELSSDSIDPYSVPDGGRVLYVSGGEVYLASLDDMSSPETVDVPASGARFSSDGRLVSGLRGARDATTGVEWLSLETGVTGVIELGLTLRDAVVSGASVDTTEGVESARVTRLVALHGRDGEEGRFDVTVATFTPDVDGMETRMDQLTLGRYPLVDRVDVTGTTLYFTGAPTGCEVCLTGYSMPLLFAGALPQGVTQGALGVRGLSTNGSGVVTVSTEDGEEVLRRDGNRLELPDGVERVESAAGMSRDGSLVISGARADGSYALWWLNGRNGKWYKLPGVPADPAQVDWAR